MANLIYGIASSIKTWLSQLQVKHFLSVVLIGLLLLTGTACTSSGSTVERNPKALSKKVDTTIHKTDSKRPKTTGEWKQEARETKNAPGERFDRIKEQSKEAVKEFGKVYPDTAQKSARSFNENAR
jgi:hypothetical protein